MKKKAIKLLIEDENLIPVYCSALAAGADVCSASREDIIILPSQSILVPTGIRLEIPEGYEIQVRPRSGLAFKNQITVLNAPGTIDADYRGELKILLINHGKSSFTVSYGMRIAQIVLAEVIQAEFFVAEAALSSTVRGEGGFGHTGC